MSATLDVVLAGEALRLVDEGVVLRPESGEAFVADLHLGKGSAFRQAGVAVPSGDSEADLARLASLVERHGVRHLWILGDLVHAPTSWTPALRAVGEAWRERVAGVAVSLVRGNHDRRGGDPPASWDVEVHDAPRRVGRLELLHEPLWDDAGRPDRDRPAGHGSAGPGFDAPDSGAPGSAEPAVRLAGHLHPVVRVGSGRGNGVRSRCFWWRGGTLVLPAFGGFTGGSRIEPTADDRVFAAGPGAVIELPAAALGSARHRPTRSPKRDP